MIKTQRPLTKHEWWFIFNVFFSVAIIVVVLLVNGYVDKKIDKKIGNLRIDQRFKNYSRNLFYFGRKVTALEGERMTKVEGEMNAQDQCFYLREELELHTVDYIKLVGVVAVTESIVEKEHGP
ncbi:hypothetical protein KAR91_25950 [Candidatus Pacearchaeota archaeon]|nr:hypothetical protein [Candidatus Pacearchaeota archaeon]